MKLEAFGFLEIDHEKLATTDTPYKVYAELLDPTSQQQFYDVLSQPYVTYGALMPDAHAGYSMPIGGVCSTKDMVVPQFVGFDIGCGMCAYKTEFSKAEVEAVAKEVHEGITTRVPLGFKKHKHQQSFKYDLPLTEFANHLLQTVGLKQLGTLGGGNHFIEVGYGSDDQVWIVIHSGSRGFGHKIASHYMYQAYMQGENVESKLEKIMADFEERNKGFKEHNPEGYAKSYEKVKNKQLVKLNGKTNLDNLEGIWGLDVNSALGQAYIMDQAFALNFALENRKQMIMAVHDVLNEALGKEETINFESEHHFINRNHNHAEYNEARGEWIHRKGATHAEEGMYGVIPGNMRDGSFVVKGKGAKGSLFSSSHGAGRVMSRKKAKENVTMEAFEASMQGITGTVDAKTLDESPFAYKDIFEVMRLQDDLVEVVEHIKVLINVKDNSSRF
jgi:tRNA-splicing ligase RtcB